MTSQRIAFVLNALTGEELKAGNRDVARVYSLLTDQKLGGCTIDSPKPLHECKNRNEFWEAFSPILKQWRVENQLLFYFSGHGDISQDQYCLKLGQDFLTFTSLMSDLKASKVSKAILILDACHSGAALGVKGDSNDTFSTIKQAEIPRGIAIVASSLASQRSYELSDGSASVFTTLLCKGIETGLDDKPTENGFITVGDITDYIKNKLESDEQYSSYPARPLYSVNSADSEIWIAKNRSGNLATPIKTDASPVIKSSSEETSIPSENASVESLDSVSPSILKTAVKIVLYPEPHQSKNEAFVKAFLQTIFATEGYEIETIHYTGLDDMIDLRATHQDNNETAYIEYKATGKPSQNELKTFAFNLFDCEATYGYFIHTEALEEQVAQLKAEWATKKRYENITFLGVEQIIERWITSQKVVQYADMMGEIEKKASLYKFIFVYSYFGIFYLIIPYDGTKRTQYYLYHAETGKQVVDTALIADEVHSAKTSIHNALKTSIAELDKLTQAIFESSVTAASATATPTDISSPSKTEAFAFQKPHLAFLYPEPIDKAFAYDFTELLKGFKSYDIEIDFWHLSEDNLSRLDEYHYAFIFTPLYKNQLCIEDENLTSKLISVADFESSLWTDNNITKCIFIFTPEAIDFNGVETQKPIANCVCQTQDINKTLKQLANCLFNEQQFKDKFYCQRINAGQIKLEKFSKAKQPVKPNRHQTQLPALIDAKALQNFIGRKTDQEKLLDKILQLKDTAQVLNVKGAGGLGKTTIVKKMSVDLAKRNHFPDGIAFIACESLTDCQAFESQLSSCFDMDNVINLTEHLTHYERFDKLIILDNFETLLTLDNQAETEKTKALVNFVCEYATIVITSRQVIGYEFEDVYELSPFSTDDALELFCLHYKQKLDSKDKKLLRTEILENLLNNNPLAIKIIVKNLPRHKDLNRLKEELEEHFFEMTSEKRLEEIFAKDADTNIEKTRSLYHSINYSYQQLDNRDKLAFELLHLFPDGIPLENFKQCFSRKSGSQHKSVNRITDYQIKILEDKSLVESSKHLVKLQSIVSRFAEYQFNNRSKKEKARYFKDAYAFNRFLVLIINTFSKKSISLAVSLFDSMSNNILKSLDYLAQFEGDQEEKLDYINDFENFILDANQTTKLSDKLRSLEENPLFNDNEILLLKLIGIRKRYQNIEFSHSYHYLNKVLPLEDVYKLDNDKFLDRLIIANAFAIYEMEGFTYKILIYLVKSNLFYYKSLLEDLLFRLGAYSIIDKLSEFDIEFLVYEMALNRNQLNLSALKEYLDSLYVKEHLGRMQTYYTLAKQERVERETIQKLVVTNPYTNGLKNLMYALVEEEEANKIGYFQRAITQLTHIKYYHIEGIYWYAKYLKAIHHADYQLQLETGYELAASHHYRFLQHQFVNLKNDTNEPYDEANYPFPDELDWEAYIEGYNKYWAK